MSTLTWESVLDDLASRVALAEQSLDNGNDLDPKLLEPWTPPEGLPPLPDSLLERAVAITKAQSVVRARLAKAMAELGEEIAKSPNPNRKLSPFGETTTAQYFDRSI